VTGTLKAFFVAAALACAWPAPAAQAQAAPQPAQPQPQTAGRGRGSPSPAYREAAQLPPRIMTFAVDRTEIRQGESATLSWATENPNVVTIEPGIGRVTPHGIRSVSPLATTTYTLTVTGAGNATLTRAVTVTVPGTIPAAAPPSATTTGPRPVPRTPEGRPDLTGVYGYGAAGRGAPAPGDLPATPTLKPGAESFRVVRAPDDTGQYAECRPPGIPQTFFVPYYVQFVQAPRHVVILHEYLHLFRVIPTDGTPHPPDPDPTWMGHAVGRWDGDTLVVDSIGFNDKTEISGYRHTEALHVVERFTRATYDTLHYEAAIEDPNVFAGPWRITRTFPLLPHHDRIDEFVCENNRDYRSLFREQGSGIGDQGSGIRDQGSGIRD
jgi:hypothetical protein